MAGLSIEMDEEKLNALQGKVDKLEESMRKLQEWRIEISKMLEERAEHNTRR